MKTIKNILTAAGFMVMLFGCCLTVPEDDKWYIPMLIELGGITLMGTAVLMNHLQRMRTLKSDKQKRRRDRHCSDADKLRQSEDMKNTYNELILNQIWQ